MSRGGLGLRLDALVVKQLDVDVLAGNLFLVTNDIAVRPSKRQIIIQGVDSVEYGSQSSEHNDVPSARHTQTFLLRYPRKTFLLPGITLSFKLLPALSQIPCGR